MPEPYQVHPIISTFSSPLELLPSNAARGNLCYKIHPVPSTILRIVSSHRVLCFGTPGDPTMSLQSRRFLCLIMLVFTARMLTVLPLSSHRDLNERTRQPCRLRFHARAYPESASSASSARPLVRFKRQLGDKTFYIKQLRPFRDCIDVNRSSRDRLMILPEIGERLAMLIIDHRETVGPFRSIDELRDLPGVTERIFARIEEWVCVAP